MQKDYINFLLSYIDMLEIRILSLKDHIDELIEPKENTTPDNSPKH